MWNRRNWMPLPILAATAAMSFAQCPATGDGATYPNPPLTYPMTSNRYTVQYQLGNSGAWVTAQVYISYYGGTDASPYRTPSNYPADESLSFVSIPAAASTEVAVRVTKIWGNPFPAVSQMSVRPKAKGISISSVSATTVQLATTTAAGFAGDQFVLWWNVGPAENSDIQGLAIFLDQPYVRPTGSNVKVVQAPEDLTGDLSHFDTLDFEGTVAIGTSGAQAFDVPANIDNVFLGPGAWVQGKLQFTQSGVGATRKIYGPGVLDVSRFNYANRQCASSSPFAADGYGAISWPALASPTAVPDIFVMDGVILSDLNHYADDLQQYGTVNNVKVLSWNGENAALRLGIGTSASNVFIHVGDDSLMVWGSYVTVTNATVWQGWNGGVVSIGWDDNIHGDDCLIDGLYVVATDWSMPNTPSWDSTNLNDDNNAIIASMNTPTVTFGKYLPSVYRNIYVEDPPRELVSLKVNPFQCGTSCAAGPSVLNLDLENVFTPPSTLQNPIGFQNVNGVPLTGSMNIALTNVMLVQPNGTSIPLNSISAGNIATNGSNINIVFPPTPTVMQFSASPNPATSGQTVTLTATILPAAATGTVSFFDGDYQHSYQLRSGQAVRRSRHRHRQTQDREPRSGGFLLGRQQLWAQCERGGEPGGESDPHDDYLDGPSQFACGRATCHPHRDGRSGRGHRHSHFSRRRKSDRFRHAKRRLGEPGYLDLGGRQSHPDGRLRGRQQRCGQQLRTGDRDGPDGLHLYSGQPERAAEPDWHRIAGRRTTGGAAHREPEWRRRLHRELFGGLVGLVAERHGRDQQLYLHGAQQSASLIPFRDPYNRQRRSQRGLHGDRGGRP